MTATQKKKKYARRITRKGKSYIMVDARRELVLQTEECDIATGKPKSKTLCVVAQALLAQLPTLARAEVGATVVYLFYRAEQGERYGKAFRYGTPKEMRFGLKTFDKTHEWDLPPGLHKLLVPRRKLGKRVDQYTPAGIRNTKTRHLRPRRTGKHTLRHINPRFFQFLKTGA